MIQEQGAPIQPAKPLEGSVFVGPCAIVMQAKAAGGSKLMG